MATKNDMKARGAVKGERLHIEGCGVPFGSVAVRCEDDSGRPDIKPGDYLVVTPVPNDRSWVRRGKIVVVERRRGTLINREIRRVRIGNDGQVMLRGRLRKWVGDLPYPSADETMRVLGVVTKVVSEI